MNKQARIFCSGYGAAAPQGFRGRGARRRGTILVSVMLIGGILIAMAVSLVGLATQQVNNRARYETYKDEFAAAELVLSKTLGQIQFMNQSNVANFLDKIAALDDTLPTLPGYTFSNYKVEKIFEGQKPVPAGQDFELMDSYTITYRVDITAKKTGGTAGRFDHPGVRLRQNFSVLYIPMYAFAIFYDDTLEIAPGAYMTVTGRVHSNGNTYVQSNAGLDFLKQVTVAGGLYHGRYSESGQSGSNGDVRFSNGTGLVSMNTGGGWYDHTAGNWVTGAEDRWGGYVKDSAQGVSRVGLPIPSSIDPHAIIERADNANDCYALQQQKFENKAGLKIFRTGATVSMEDADGNAVLPTYKVGAVTKSILTQTTFYDAREKKTIASIDLNIANLIESGKSPANGIVYVSSGDVSGNMGAVRLLNGAKLPSTGFTVATENPLYIKGDYNTTDKTMAMVVADALTIQSNNWNDANSTKAIGSRTATETKIQAVCMQGIVSSAGGKYSGGVENYFRLLEEWTGKKLKFEGSLINLWESTKATGKWQGTGTVYNPPTREWAWDKDLGGTDGPPGGTRGVVVTRDGWEMPEVDAE